MPRNTSSVTASLFAAAALAIGAAESPAKANVATGTAATWLSSVPREGLIDFTVRRDGDVIGHHRLSFTREGETVTVDIDIRLEVKLAFITVFDYQHRNREIWRDGKLISVSTATDNNGDDLAVRAERTGDGVTVVGPRYSGLAPADILPSSYWNVATIQAGALLNTQDGRIARVTATDLGPQTIEVGGVSVDARHYRLNGDNEMDLWYDRNGLWVKTTFVAPGDSAQISYELRQPVTPAVAPDAPAATATR